LQRKPNPVAALLAVPAEPAMSSAMNPEPPNGTTGSAPGLDELALSRLRELDPDGRNQVLQRVLSAFETSLMRMLAQLTAERQNGHPGVVMSVAHTLKSSSASVGALQLSKACAAVERRLHDGAAGDLQADVEALLVAGESALVAVRAMLRT
jgi:HPt (histidine-containing phosphotransfer) domain-containing protein